MYLSFYGLKENPFRISTNPQFLWLGEKHQEALATLRYGVIDNKGFLLLTGDVGTGKTTLINALLASLEKDVLAATVPDPGLDHLDLYLFIAAAFGIKGDFSSKGKFLVLFSKFLHDAYENGKKVLLIIDEAQRISPELLEEIRLLSNIEIPEAKLINIFFVGQIEFNSILLRDENRALRQRISAHYNIPSLSVAEVDSYLKHRLKVAGADHALFNPAAVAQIHLFSSGFPRLINVIADRALLTGFVSERREIGPQIILECARELQIKEPLLVRARRRSVQDRSTHEDVPSKDENVQAAEGEGSETEDASLPIPEEGTARSEAEETSVEKAKSLPEVRTRRRRSRSLLPSFLILLALALALVGACFYFYPREMQRVAADTKERLIDFKQSWFRSASSKDGTIASGIRAGKGQSAHLPEDLPGAGSGAEETAFGEKMDGAREETVAGKATSAIGAIASGIGKGRALNVAGEPAPKDADGRTGFEIPKQAAVEGAEFSSKPYVIGFDHNSNNLTLYGASVLERLAEQLKTRPYNLILVRGYSDAVGGENYNKNISLFRASIVKSYLMAKGVDPKTILTAGLGSENPVASNETSEGRRKNRRVEIEVRR